ncbi:MAG: GAF domain-containing protein [Armatimonadetes bacterium]|nr:GAF domain-containing protein [Armatimonadota bacterium]
MLNENRPAGDALAGEKTEHLGNSQLRLLLEIGRYFNSTLEFGEVLTMVMDQVLEVFKAGRGCIFNVRLEPEVAIELMTARSTEKSSSSSDAFSVSQNLLHQVIQSREPVLSSNATQDPRFNTFRSVSLHSIRSIMAVPIIFKDSLTGIIYVDNQIKSGLFNKEHLELLTAIAHQAAGAIENARLYEMKKKIILVLANAIEAKDLYTRGHIERVCRYSLAIAKELGLPFSDLRDLEICSFLHDAGKIGVPDAVLQKPGHLTDDEFEQIKKHPALGEALVLPIDIPARIKLAIRQHQERWDGRGYPDRLSGEEIHLFARIIAVADTWDAMTSDRPYRVAMPRSEAMRELKHSAGTQLDPVVVDAFLRTLERGDEGQPVVSVSISGDATAQL